VNNGRRPSPVRAAVLLAGLSLSGSARADQIITADRSFVGANVVGFDAGYVAFRAADGALHREWVADVKVMVVDRGTVFTDFNQAERFRNEGQVERSLIRYQRALRTSEGFWTALVASRQLLACDEAGRLDAAVRSLLVLLKTEDGGVETAARLLPRNLPDRRTRRLMRAVEHLDAVLLRDPPPGARALLELLRYDLLRRAGDARAREAARRAAQPPLPPEARVEAVYRIRLTALAELFEQGGEEALVAAALDEAIRHAPESLLPAFLMLKGRMQARHADERVDLLRASWPFLRVAVHFPQDPRVPEALYEAARLLVRADDPADAMRLLDECLANKNVTAEVRQRAETLRQRLGSAPRPSSDPGATTQPP